ncbi:hypothetical protein E2C01_060714 [Portunus trituberculatus]|uniref:Uncharacterized protein n=1 Tax=Portunus trituberculatus TaxID=210409 RepID=A0A5B7HA79_PORTR|nr:hypothetical protein [Portunus trituberculatus]
MGGECQRGSVARHPPLEDHHISTQAFLRRQGHHETCLYSPAFPYPSPI